MCCRFGNGFSAILVHVLVKRSFVSVCTVRMQALDPPLAHAIHLVVPMACAIVA